MFEKRAVEAWTLKDKVKGDGFRKNTNVSNLKKVKTIDLEGKVNATIVERKININIFFKKDKSILVQILLTAYFLTISFLDKLPGIDVLLMKL